MKKKQISFLLILTSIIIFASSCANENLDPSTETNTTQSTQEVIQASIQLTEKTLNWNIGSEPKYLDPQLNKTLDGGSVINNTFEGLFRNFDNKIIPAIATDYHVSEDGLTYTFKLRESNWSDGTPLLASDFEYAWKRALDPATASEYAYLMYYIKGGREYNEGSGKREDVQVHALDDYTLEVTLNAPTAYFIDLLTYNTYYPTKQSVVEATPDGAWAIDPDKVVCNGPFILTEYKTGDMLVLSKNITYWNADQVKIDTINAFMIVDENTMLTAFESGDLDIIDNILAVEAPRLQAQEDTFFSEPTVSTYYYGFNTTIAPLNDVRVRKALSLAIDRKAIVESITKAGEIAASGFTPPGLFDANGDEFHKVAGDYDIDINEPDIETAKQLLAEAGYVDLTNFPKLELIYSTNETNNNIAQAIQFMWKENLGIDIELVNQEWAVFQETKRLKNYMIAKGGWYGDYADPMAMLEIMTSTNSINTTGWENKTYDQLIETAQLASGQERFDLLYKAQSILMEEVPIMPIFYSTDLFMIAKHVVNWDKTAVGMWFFGNVELTLNN